MPIFFLKHMDDVMRQMLENFSGEKGFISKNIEETVHEICGCDVHSFFTDHVFGSKEIDFNKYLKLAGLQMNVALKDVLSDDGKLVPDLRIYSWQKKDEDFLRIAITNPRSCWGNAGLHTGDIIKSVKGIRIKTTTDFRQVIRSLKIGDSVALEVEKPSGIIKINVLIKGYQQPQVQIQNLPTVSQKQKNLFTQWNE